MELLEIAESYGILIFRRRFGSRFRPHLSVRVRELNVDFHVDSSPGRGYNIITHAHTDHYGNRNMKNFKAIASVETSRILNATENQPFRGIVHNVGEKLSLSGVTIETYPTHHMHGSSAYYFRENNLLITGDVKDYSNLPRCDVLITEATYGHPVHVFNDELDRVIEVAEQGYELGVYPIGKAQRIASLLSKNGIGFQASEKIEKICKVLGIEFEPGDSRLVSPKEVKNGFVLSAQRFYRRRIVVSDHVDYEGIIDMVNHCDPEYVIFYHGNPTNQLIEELESDGRKVLTLRDINVSLS
ncbi:MBL fold metallo-hydrolase [Geoglobus acetivorans]|uniref:mRNA 3'-end processing factor n=1 Tax=Geoglobus acetivorans TaxID=565033 RepID=A0A0A7GCR4_GEOAI|nr:mRNA 3'-end processing factor [Geoglobus acetivorans]